MKDLTQGSIVAHVLAMAAPIAISLVAQTAYQFVALYFISHTGVAATAGLSTAGGTTFISLALAQIIGVGTTVTVAHATGRKNRDEANRTFNQSLTLSIVTGALVALLMCVLIHPYLRYVAADADTSVAGTTFILWALPGLAVTFPAAALGSSLRGTGVVTPLVIMSVITVVLNIVLAPVLISGWGIGTALGIKGAGLAISLSALIGLVFLALWFRYSQDYLSIDGRLMLPRLSYWRRIAGIGLPAGGESVLTFIAVTLMYYVVRDFGVSVQAGVGVGIRVANGILLPATAIAATVGPIGGQNFGARDARRVRETFRTVALLGTVLMLLATVLAKWSPRMLVTVFSPDPASIGTAMSFLSIYAWAFIAEGLILTSSSMFQALGNAVPSFVCYLVRCVVFLVPAVWMSTRKGFQLEQAFYMSIAAVAVQVVLSLWLLRGEFRRKLTPFEAVGSDPGKTVQGPVGSDVIL